MCWHGGFREYVSVAERRAKARRQMDRLRKRGHTIEPVEIQGRIIARSYWGKSWCDHLQSFSDFSNRLPRGRTYARNGSVCHLTVKPGLIEAYVAGSDLYQVNIRVSKLDVKAWNDIKHRCAGQIGSMLELLKGKLSDRVMAVVTDREAGLFPKPGQIKLDCSCPDWATMCKHVAAVLYGVGNRLDTQPELLFTLRGVDPQELIAANLGLPEPADGGAQTLADDQLADVFGIDLDESPSPPPAGPGNDAAATRSPARKKARPRSKARVKATSAQPRSRSAKRNGRPALHPTAKSIARLRRRLGANQQQLAELLGVSPATVARWESTPGRLKLQRRCLEALADVKQAVDPRPSSRNRR